MPLSPKTPAPLGVILAIGIIAIFAFFAYSFLTAPQKVAQQLPVSVTQTPDQVRESLVAGWHDKYYAKTISYFDQNYSFKLRYPVGYSAEVDPVPGVRLRVSAFYPPFSSELMDVRVLNSTDLTPELISESAKQANTSALQYAQKGVPLYILSFKQPDLVNENESVLLREAFYQCPDHWLAFVAAFSEPLAPDLELADYMISTLEC